MHGKTTVVNRTISVSRARPNGPRHQHYYLRLDFTTLPLRQVSYVISSLKQHLYPAFSPMPSYSNQKFGGYYGELQPPGEDVDDTIHNLYEEIPCLGVLSEAVRAAISNANPGPYDSLV
ncbi:hypothetical protein ACI65C_005207 [Semiaphis heraclei]